MPTPYDQFNVALAGVPSDEERQRQVADRLRGQTGLGAYFQTLGDPMTAKAGAGMMDKAVQQTSALQRTRLEEERQAMVQREAGMERELKERLAHIKAASDVVGDYQKPTATEQREDEDTMLALQQITDLEASFEDEFAVMKMGGVDNLMNMAEEAEGMSLGGTPIPGGRQFSNFLVNKAGVDKENWARSNQWWKDMNIKYNFPERYKLFGATLTGSEKSSWDKVAAGESMDPKTVRMLMRKVKAGMTQKARKRAGLRRAAGFSPGYVSEVFGAHGQPLSEEDAAELTRINQTVPYFEELGYAEEQKSPGGTLEVAEDETLQIDVPVWDDAKKKRLAELEAKYGN